MPDRDSEIGQRLRQLRLRLGLSQREVGRRAGVSNATISMIEANRVSPSVSALKQILSALGAGLADFFASSDDDRERVVFRAQHRETWQPLGRSGCLHYELGLVSSPGEYIRSKYNGSF